MKHIDPIERIRKVKAEIVALTEMIRETDNIYVMQNCVNFDVYFLSLTWELMITT